MEITRRSVLQGAAAVTAVGALAGCTTQLSSKSTTTASATTKAGKYSLVLSADKWSYDSTNDVYYQIGRHYVGNPDAPAYENLSVYVPGNYFTATKNSDGTYTAKIHSSRNVGKYTASTAPIVFPVNTPGYAAQQPPTSYSYTDIEDFMKAGLIYVAAGLRGRDSETATYVGNAPWGVTDLKAAVRYIRYNSDVIPGDKEKIAVFGHSGGGAQSAVMGASGNSRFFTPYLTSIGAAMTDRTGRTISDAIAGAMCWCPITSLDFANAAYEWNMGQFFSTGTRASGTWTKAYSNDLTSAFMTYINDLRLKDSAGTTLKLTRSKAGHYLSGSYYAFVLDAISKSLNRFLSYTTFPYTPSSATMGGMGGGAPTGGASGAPTGGTSGAPTGTAPTGGTGTGAGAPTGGSTSGATTSTTYKTVAEYIDYLNMDSTWVKYDSSTNKATVLNLAGFVKSQKNASKDVGAFDGVARAATENVVMGHGTTGLHFAPVAKKVIQTNQSRYAKLSGWKSAYAASSYATDFLKKDAIGKDQAYRVNMYNPMYFLSDYYRGYKTTTVAPHWRIRTGIQQPDTANTVELNLASALRSHGATVDFATVWGEAHTMAEETGQPIPNFIKWVEKTLS